MFGIARHQPRSTTWLVSLLLRESKQRTALKSDKKKSRANLARLFPVSNYCAFASPSGAPGAGAGTAPPLALTLGMSDWIAATRFLPSG